MTGSAIEKLYFSIGLIDKVTGPSKGVTKAINQIQRSIKQGLSSMAIGGGTVYATAKSILGLTDNARDFNKALKEVDSLDVKQKELKALGNASKRFALDFGGSAADVVRSGYDIQSSINGLDNGELGKFTYAGAVLAKGTKSTAAEITDYTGTMYGIFESTAKKMGKTKWIEQMTGQTATAVRMFKTTGSKMAEAFSRLGSAGEKAGIKMADQMAIMGTLGATMSGSESATRFNAFIQGIGKAQKALKLKFTDPSGKMLPVVEILERIKASKFGDMSNIANQDALKNAFGTKEAVQFVQNLMDKTGQLKKSMNELSQVKGMDPAIKMAKTMVDETDKMQGMWDVMKITFGSILLPGVYMTFSALSKLGQGLIWLMDMFPPLRWAIASVVAMITVLAISWGTMKIVMGVGAIFNAIAIKLRIMRIALWKANVITGNMTKTQKLAAIANWLYQKSITGVTSAVNFLRLNLIWKKAVEYGSAAATWLVTTAQAAMALGFWGSCAAVWGFTVALLACPITWIVIGIVALIGALVACIYYWDEICDFVVKYADYLLMMLGPIGWVIAAFRNWDKIVDVLKNIWGWFKKACPNIANLIEKLFSIWWSGVTGIWTFWKGVWNSISGFFSGVWNGIIDTLAEGFLWIANLGSSVWNGLLEGCREFNEYLANMLLPVVQMVGGWLEWLGNIPGKIWGAITSMFSGLDGWIGKVLRTVAKIPGLGFLDPDVQVNQPKVEQPVVSSVTDARKKDVNAGGLRSTTNNRTTNYGGVTINTSSAVGPGQLEDMWALQG